MKEGAIHMYAVLWIVEFQQTPECQIVLGLQLGLEYIHTYIHTYLLLLVYCFSNVSLKLA